jgi:pyrroloquinoline quinone biosynthesis protein E
MIELAVEMGAKRVEIAHTQYYGWAFKNRRALMPTYRQTLDAIALVEEARRRLEGVIVIDSVVPDYYARFPKACVGGWGRRAINITPQGRVLPCHAAETIPGLVFDNVKDKPLSEIWLNSEAFNAFRGTDWMPDLCRNCDRKEIDWGGCRCQAMAITGSASETDPACSLSPLNATLRAMAEEDSAAEPDAFRYRRFGG